MNPELRLQRRLTRSRHYGPMTPNDPRHGTDTGYTAGCREDCCRRGHARRHKEDRIYPNPLVDATGSRRRIQALARMGWSTAELSRRLGKHRSYLLKVLKNDRVQSETAALVALLYDQLSMRRATGPVAARTAAEAQAAGWPPPLAWDDIDNDPDPYREELDTQTRRVHARGWETSANRVEDAEWLADCDETLTGACRRLGISPDGLWRACDRVDRLDVYDRLARRELDGEMRQNVRSTKRTAA